MCSDVLQYITVYFSMLQYILVIYGIFPYLAEYLSILQCISLPYMVF